MKTFFTSESVTSGHPDKVCDQIADRILDAMLAQDPRSRVACEVTAITDKVHVMGEITTCARMDYENIIRKTIADIGYTEAGYGFDADTCEIEINVHEQSKDIAMGVDRGELLDSGAGDQGMMFGYACNETSHFMPLPIELAHHLTKQLTYIRQANILPYLLPDGKAQITIEYFDHNPVRISTVVVSTQHRDYISIEQLRKDIIDQVIYPALPHNMLDRKTEFFVNPTGRFVIGGPAGDSGLTGRKLMVDTYGGYARHGGGSFSGKDPTKVDRSGAYMARYIAKNIVAAKLAERCELQLSYAIGLADPIAFLIDTFGTEKVPIEQIQKMIKRSIDLRPAAIIERFGLRRPLYSQVACYGHFGENAKEMPWEQMDLAKKWENEIKK